MAESTHYQILECVARSIVDLNLPGLPAARVVVLKSDYAERPERLDAGGYPCVLVMHSGESETYDGVGSTNVHEEIGFPVAVVICDTDRPSGQPDQDNEHDQKLYWREQITRRFLNSRLGCDCVRFSVCRITMNPRPIMIRADWVARSMWKSPLHFNFWARIPRYGYDEGDAELSDFDDMTWPDGSLMEWPE